MNKQTVTIYALVDPDSQSVRYVGWSVAPDRRYREHLYRASQLNRHSSHWIAKLLRHGKKPIQQILETVPVEMRGEREQYWIRYYRALDAPLTNHSEGGVGPVGIERTEETKAKIRAAYTPERKERHRLLMTGLKRTAEQIAKMRNRFKGIPLKQEHRDKLSQSKKEMFASPGGQSIRQKYHDRYAQLSDAQVAEIWSLLKEGKLSQQAIANKFGTTQSIISDIKRKRRYSIVTDKLSR